MACVVGKRRGTGTPWIGTSVDQYVAADAPKNGAPPIVSARR
jgi:hypothetical protein